jgi:hypothetical protein
VTGPELRIGDQERDAAVSALGEHYAAGRLTKEEYDERSEVAWKARTNSDLAPLFRDLPPLNQAGRATPASRQSTALPTWPPRPSPSRPGGFRPPLLPMVLIVVGLVMLTDGWALPLLLLGAFLWMKVAIGRRVRARATTSRSGGAGRSPW